MTDITFYVEGIGKVFKVEYIEDEGNGIYKIKEFIEEGYIKNNKGSIEIFKTRRDAVRYLEEYELMKGMD
ncbi:MAG: hypothetical protein ACXVHS_03465 [Methanobacterium sp.]